MKGRTIRQALNRNTTPAVKKDKALKLAEQDRDNQLSQGVSLGAVVAAAAVGAVIGNAMARSDTPLVVNPVEPGHEHDCGI
jgi:hypothetical protein